MVKFFVFVSVSSKNAKISVIFGIYLGNKAKYKKSGRTMTFAAVKLVQVQIFASIGKVIAKKNGNNEKSARPTDARPTDRATPARHHDCNTLWAFSPRGKKGNALNSLII